MISIKDVAKKAGVSISTVSNVINGNKPVSDDLKVRVEDAIKELNFTINPVARGLKSSRTHTIGVIMPKITRLFFPLVLSGIQETANKHGYSVVFYDANEIIENEKKYMKLLEKSWVDGVILDSCADMEIEQEYLNFIKHLGGSKKHIPVVSIENTLGQYADSVSIDNYMSGYEATKHLIGLGHKKIAHISGINRFSFSRRRSRGYRQALTDNGLEVNEDWIQEGDFTPMSGYNCMKRILTRGLNFTALFAANDQMAIGAIKAIREEGLKVPDDVAVMGFDNLFVSSILSPSVSTVNVPRYQMGASAVELIHERIKSNDFGEKKEIILPTHLIKRQSTEPRAQSSWDLYGW